MKIEVKHTQAKPTIILNVILDESGSMSSHRDSVISGFNEYVQTMQDKTEDADYIVNVVKFNDKSEVLFKNKTIKNVNKLTALDYNPGNYTALYDAIGTAIVLTDSQINTFYPSAKSLFFVFTDGFENASKEYTSHELGKMIKNRECEQGWTFTFIGADKNCIRQASALNINVGNTIWYNAQNVHQIWSPLSTATASYTSNLAGGTYTGTKGSSLNFFKDAGLSVDKPLDEQNPPATNQK